MLKIAVVGTGIIGISHLEMMEKPIANTVEECDKMIEAAEKSGKKLAVGHIQRFFPKSMCPDGHYGRAVIKAVEQVYEKSAN